MNLNPVELFKVAVKIEENGISFYKKASHFAKEILVKEIFDNLAKMEEDHLHFFSRLEKNVRECGYIDSEDIKVYLDRNFGPEIFKTDDAVKIGRELKTILDIFRFALEKENISIDFYTKIRGSIGNLETQKTLDKIIEEEKGHAKLILENIKKIER